MKQVEVELLRSSNIDGGFFYPELRLRLARGYSYLTPPALGTHRAQSYPYKNSYGFFFFCMSLLYSLLYPITRDSSNSPINCSTSASEAVRVLLSFCASITLSMLFTFVGEPVNPRKRSSAFTKSASHSSINK